MKWGSDFQVYPEIIVPGRLQDLSGIALYPAQEWLVLAPQCHLCVLQLTFTAFHIENHPVCKWDSVTILNGGSPGSPVIGRYCGDTSPGTIRSGSNKLVIIFNSDHSVQGGGFYATWTAESLGKFALKNKRKACHHLQDPWKKPVVKKLSIYPVLSDLTQWIEIWIDFVLFKPPTGSFLISVNWNHHHYPPSSGIYCQGLWDISLHE